MVFILIEPASTSTTTTTHLLCSSLRPLSERADFDGMLEALFPFLYSLISSLAQHPNPEAMMVIKQILKIYYRSVEVPHATGLSIGYISLSLSLPLSLSLSLSLISLISLSLSRFLLSHYTYAISRSRRILRSCVCSNYPSSRFLTIHHPASCSGYYAYIFASNGSSQVH